MFKSHLAFLCFDTPPAPASVGLRCQVALDLGALPETRSMGPAASPVGCFEAVECRAPGQLRRSASQPASQAPLLHASSYKLHSDPRYFWLEDGWRMVGGWLDAFFIHNFDMISTLQEPPSRRPAGVAWRHRWPRPCTDSWSHCQAWRTTGTRKIWWKRMDNWEKNWEMYCER